MPIILLVWKFAQAGKQKAVIFFIFSSIFYPFTTELQRIPWYFIKLLQVLVKLYTALAFALSQNRDL